MDNKAPFGTETRIEFIDKIYYLLLGFVILFGIIYRIGAFVYNNSFWYDEASLGLNIIEKNYWEMFAPLDYFQVCPPLFMIVSKFLYNLFGCANSAFARDMILRILPFFASIISVPLFAYVLHKVFNNKYLTLFATCLVSFNRIAINYAQEFKQYSLEMLFSVILLYVFYKFDLKTFDNKKILVFSLIFSIAPWFAYSSVFILPFGILIILCEIFKYKIFDKIKLFYLFSPLFLSGTFFLIHYSGIKNAHLGMMQEYWTNNLPSFFNFGNFAEVFQHKTTYLLNIPSFECFLLVFLSALVIFVLRKDYKAFLITVGPILLSVVFAFLNKYPYEARLILFLLPFFAIIFSQFVYFFKEDRASKCVVLFLALIMSAQLFRHSAESRIMHMSKARQFLKTIISSNEKNKFIIAYTPMAKYYLPLSKDGKILNIKIYATREREIEIDKDMIDKLNDNSEIWFYSPQVSEVHNLTIDLLNDKKRYDGWAKWRDTMGDGFLVRVRKK